MKKVQKRKLLLKLKPIYDKFISVFDIMVYTIFLIIVSPYLFATGGISRIKRYHRYVRARVHGDEPKKYYY